MGFLFRPTGRTIFILFVASVCFGVVGNQAWVGITVGVITFLNALFNCWAILEHPGFHAVNNVASSGANEAGVVYAPGQLPVSTQDVVVETQSEFGAPSNAGNPFE